MIAREAHGCVRIVSAIALALLSSIACAQPAIDEFTPQALRRIFVPVDQLDPEARGLLPLQRVEFERRIAKYAATATPAVAPPAAAITSAVYRATLQNDVLAQGTAELTIERRKSVTAGGNSSEFAWLMLSPCSLAMGVPAWSQGNATSNEPAANSATFGQNEKQQLLLAVPESGDLKFGWSQRGRRDERGRVKFALELPPATRQRLELRVPASWMLSSDNALARELGGAKAGSDSLWQVEVAGGNRVEFLAQPRQTDALLPPLVLVRETGSYVFTPGQVDLELSLELDINRAPLRQIRVRHDPRLKWTAIRWGEQNLSWSNEKAPSGEPVAVISLPEPLLGPSRLIQLTAVADWSPMPTKWSLPKATVEDALWQEGRVNVAAPRWLQLDVNAGPGGRLSATTLAGDSQGMDLLQFQLERSTANIEVQPANVPLPLDATSLTTLQVEPRQIVASVAAELTVGSGQQFSLECEIPRSWIIDSLETSPPELLEDRGLRPRGNSQVITLQLRQPLRANRPLRINARLRHVRTTGAENWGDEMLQPLQFMAAASTQRYVTLQLADSSFEPRLLSADGLEFLTATQLPAKVRALSDSPLGNWLMRLTDAARQPRFQLSPGSALYAAESTLRIQLTPEHVDYRLRIECEPESTAVSSLLVQLRPAPATEPQWLFAGDERPLVAQRVEAMIASGDQPQPALYRIELPRARDTSFVIDAQWSDVLQTATAAPLAELPEANTHAAHVELYGALDGLFSWQAQRLRPLPFSPENRELRARYRYQAGQDATLTISPLAATQRSLAGWISRCDVDSEFSPTGGGRHEARYVVMGNDVEVLELRLPETASLARAAVDGHEVLAFSRTNDPRWLSIPLRGRNGAPRTSSPLVRIEYTSPPSNHRGWLTARWSAPLPTTRLPVLQSYWQLRFPGNWQPWPHSTGSLGTDGRQSSGIFVNSLQALLWPTGISTTVTRDLPATADEVLAVYSPSWFGLLALVVALAAAAAVLRLRNWNPFRLLSAAVAWLAISLLLGDPWGSFAQAALAGWLTGFALQLFQRPLKTNQPAPAPASTGFAWQPQARLWLLLFGISSLLSWSSRSDDVLHGAEPDARPWRVVIPIDADQKPTDYVYVSPPLYAALFRAETRGGDQPAWLVRNAQYELRWNGSAAPELQGYSATFEIENFQEQTLLRLPFQRDQIRLSDPGVRIEGEAASATWSAAGDLLQIECTGIGRKRLEIGLALVAPLKDGAMGGGIRIPAVANSRVLVPALPSGEQITITTALGSEQASTSTASLVELGATDQLAVHWSRTAAEPAPVVEVEQLLLWRMRPSSVVVEGKWQFRPLSGKLREVVVRADPRYRLLPTGNGANVVRQFTDEGETNLHHFVLDKPVTGDFSLTASFLLVGSTGIGNLVPPRFEPVADRVARDWQGAWIAPGLQWNGKQSTLTTAEFLQAWGDPTLAPVQAFRAAADAPRPTLAVIAAQSRLQAEQQIEWTLTPDQTSVRYRLSGPLLPASVNQFRLQLPPQFAVRRVAVTQGDEAVASRWLRHADGLLTIVLDETRVAAWVVEVTAERAHVAGKQTTLPVLQTSEIDLSHYECVIRKRAGAAVTLGKLTGWKEEVATPATEAYASPDRLVARLAWTTPRPGVFPPPIPLTLGAAQAGFTGELLTRALTEDDDWQLEVLAKLRSAGGTFDELQFSIPRDWEGPFEIEPAARFQVESLPGQSRNLLRVQLDQPVAGQLLLRLRAPLAIEQELIRLPVVDLIGNHEGLQRFVALPRRGADSPLQWQTAGLQPRTELPGELTNLAAGQELIYEAIIDRYRATARPERVRREAPRILLAEHHIAWQADRRVVGDTELMVLPNGSRTLLLQPPAAHELVAAIVNDVPMPLRREPGISGAATIELHSDTWPQWVRVIYRGVLTVSDDQAGRWQFFAPRVHNVPIAQTRWQIIGPTQLELPPNQTVSNVVAADEALAPFEALVLMARGAADAPAGNHAESASTWLQLWRRHWDRELEIAGKRPPSSPLAPIIAARLHVLETEMADQLNAPLATDPMSVASVGPALDSLRETAGSRSVFELRASSAGDLPSLLVIRPHSATAASAIFPWLIAGGLLIGAAVITQFARSTSLRDWVIAYPQLVLALFGCVALAMPGYLWIGGLLLACSLLATVHSPWRQRA